MVPRPGVGAEPAGRRGRASIALIEERVRRCLGPAVRSVSARPYPSTTHTITALEVVAGSGAGLRLLHKDLSADAVVDAAVGARPDFVSDPGREVVVYREVLSPAGRSPHWLGGDDGAGGEPWLLIEEVPGVPLWQLGDTNRWVAAAAWCGGFHRTAPPLTPALTRRLIRYDAAFFSRFGQRLALAAGGWERARRTQVRHVLTLLDQVIEEVALLPRHLVHGEFYPSNVVVDPAAPAMAAVDWEMAGIGTGLLDLAALVSGNWATSDRDAMVAAYRAALGADGADGDIDYHLACVEFLRCVQWLGWCEGWKAPREHAQDWLGRATRLADELGPTLI